MRTTPGGHRVGLLLVVVVNLVLIGLFFDKAWIPPDDGHYIHVADRLAGGEVLNADIEELHPGYVHFIHAWSLELFGERVVSLRYPLMALMALQSLLTFAIFRRAGAFVATIAAITMSAIGTLQIANPTTSLYALAATVGLVGLLQRTSPETRYRAVSIGALLGLVFLFRQLTAVFVVMGVLAFLLTERRPGSDRAGGSSGARLVLASSGLGLFGYLVLSTDPSAGLLFGLFPLLILGWAISHTTIGNRDLTALLARMAMGAVASALPLIAYHLGHGSVRVWARDTFVRSLSVGDLEHISVGRYARDLVANSLEQLLLGSLTARLNAAYWLVLVFAALGLGLALFVRLRRLDRGGVPSEYALPILAVFYAVVSVFNQIPYYLYLSAGLTATAGLWMWAGPLPPSGSKAADTRAIRGVGAFALALSLVGVVFHAGQPYTRTHDQVVAGDRVELVRSELPRLGLWIDPVEEERYQELLAVITNGSGADEVLFTLPNNADLYFLSGRENGFRLFNPTISILDDDELAEFVAEFERVAPALIVHDTLSAYNSDMTAELLDRITADFEPAATVDRYEVYARR